jgi:hypothetical protein
MAIESINLGSSVNAGDGDPVRTAFTKVNSNFTEVDGRLVALEDGNITTDLKGSVFGDDSTLLVDGVNSNIPYSVLSGAPNQSLSTTDTVTFLSVNQFKTVVPVADIDISLGEVFTKTVTGNITFTVSQIPDPNIVASFILELTNGGAFAVTLFNGVLWDGGVAPTLTAAGLDILIFYTHDGGTSWRGFVAAQAVA